jgi:hypothetical protein
MPGYGMAREELETGLRMVTKETLKEELAEINQQIVENFVGKNNYSVSPPKGVKNDSKCDQSHPTEKKVTTFNSIDRGLGEESWIYDKVVIKEEGKTYIYNLAVPIKPNIFCRQTENLLVECIYLSDNGYSIRVFEEPFQGSYQPYAFNDFKPCHELNYNWEGKGEQTLDLSLELRLTETPGDWTIENCDASSSVQLSTVDISEGKNYDEEGGYLEYTYCEYTTIMKNSGGLPVSILYYKHSFDEDLFYSDWVKVSARAPGEEYVVENYIDKYEENPVTASFIFRFAVIYDVPQCSWVKQDGINYEIITIIKRAPLPCTVISPNQGRDDSVFPDFTDDLIRD